jgi:circadian clock protein KaiC
MKKDAVTISTLKTGVPGLDEVLGGGLPEFSFNVIAGEPGAGKTTLAQQIVFQNATRKRPALYFTVLGEPTIKLLRYQQQMAFFDTGRIGEEVRIVNLSEEVLEHDLEAVLARMVAEVERANAGLVVVDSFRTVMSGFPAPAASELERFVQKLAIKLTSWEVTSFLVGEYLESELRNPVFTVADGTLWMTQAVERNSVVRKLQVVKMRGMPMVPGLHTMRITEAGVQVFPRTIVRTQSLYRPDPGSRLSTGVDELDRMMGGGIPQGDTVIIAGATGTGKTTFGARFVAAGCANGEAAVMVVFEEHLANFVARARVLGIDVPALEASNKLRILYLRPLDLSPDEVLFEVTRAISEIKATRVLVDSLSGFEIALAPTFRTEFRESLYRVVLALTQEGATLMLTLETTAPPGSNLALGPPELSFIADDILVQRNVEIEGRVRMVLGIAKMRGSSHSHDLREYTITATGVEMGAVLSEYDGVLTGVPRLRGLPPVPPVRRDP